MKMAEARIEPDQTSQAANTTQVEILSLVNELTQKILLKQPDNIYKFCADYLENKLDDREAKVRREERRAKRKAKKKMKQKATESQIAQPELSNDLFLSAVSSGLQEQDPLREQVSVVDAGARGPSIPPIPEDFRADPEVLSLLGHEDVVTHCAMLDDYVLTSSKDRTIKLWSLETGTKLVSLENEKPINAFVLVPKDEKYVIIAAGEDGKLVAWKLKFVDGKIKASRTNIMPCHQPNPIRAMLASPDGKHMATGCCFYMHQITAGNVCEISVRGTLKVWDLEDFVEWALHPKTHCGDIEYTAMKTMRQLIIGGKGKRSTQQDEQFYGIRAIAFSPDSQVIAVGLGRPDAFYEQDTHMVVLCETEELTTLWVQESPECQVTGLSFSGLGAGTFQSPWELLIGSQKGMQKVSFFLSGDSKERLRLRHVWTQKFEKDNAGLCMPENSRVLCSALGSDLQIRDAVSGAEVAVLKGHEAPITHLAASSDARVICTAGEDKVAKLWRFDTAKLKGSVLPQIDDMMQPRAVLPPIPDIHSSKVKRDTALLNEMV